MFKFIDLFAGIGGIRLGLQQAIPSTCVFSCEIDPNAQKTYAANYEETPFNDVTKIVAEDLPDFDGLLAGFPCQAFSHAGKRRGFEDTRGTLFFEVARIVKVKQPAVLLLENVKGLLSHDKGETFKVIHQVLEDLGYAVNYKVINAKDFGVPQKRERVYLVCFNKKKVPRYADFSFPEPSGKKVQIADILEKSVAENFFVSEQYWKTLKAHKARHQDKGHGFGYEIIPPTGVANTIVVGGMGRERNLVRDDMPKETTKVRNKEGIRMMTPREWARLQGYPDSFKFPVSNSSAYKQLGNSVAVPVIKALSERISLVLSPKK